MRQVLLVWSPLLFVAAFLVRRVVLAKVGRGNVLVINSMLNVLEVFMSDRHSHLTKRVNEFILGVSMNVHDSPVVVVENFTERLLGLFAVDLRKLLHLDLVLAHHMLFFLSQVAQVFGRSARPDLPRRNLGAF